jgi:hypothetical protein
MSNRDRKFRDLEADKSDGNHWIRLGATASAKLLARLIEHHPNEDAARLERTAPGSSSGSSTSSTNQSEPSPEETRHDEQQ